MVCGKVHHKDCGVLELKVIQVSSSQHENFEDLLLSSSSHLNGQLTSVGQFLTKHASILGREPYFGLYVGERPMFQSNQIAPFGKFGCKKEFPSSWHVPQRVPNSTSLLSPMLWQMLSSFHLYSWVAKGEELYILQKKTFYFGEPA